MSSSERAPHVEGTPYDVAVYANDVSARNALESVLEVARRVFHIMNIGSLNQAITPEEFEQAKQCHALVLGISSGQPEVQFAQKILEGNPEMSGRIFVVEDHPSSGLRSYQIGSHAHLCSILPLAEDAPERRMYCSVEPVGFPPSWKEIADNIATGRKIRETEQLHKRHRGQSQTKPLTPQESIVYVGGCKQPAKELALLSLLTQARWSRPVHLQFREHPGEDKTKLAGEIAAREAFRSAHLWDITNPELVDAGRQTEGRLLGAADVSVVSTGSGAPVHLALQGCPAVGVQEFVTTPDLLRMAKALTNVVERMEEVHAAVEALLDPNSPARKELLQRQQKNIFPVEKISEFGKKTVQFIQRILRAQGTRASSSHPPGKGS